MYHKECVQPETMRSSPPNQEANDINAILYIHPTVLHTWYIVS